MDAQQGDDVRPPPQKKRKTGGSRRIGTHHDWCFTVHGRSEMVAFVDIVTVWLRDGYVDIAVIGDELTGNAGEHAQAFCRFPQGRGVAPGTLTKELREACPSVHFEPRKSRCLDRCGNYCLKEHFKHIAELFPEKGGNALFREGSVPLLVAGWDIENAKADISTQGKRSDIDAFKDAVFDGRCKEWDTALLNHSGLAARAEGFVRQFIARYSPLDPMSASDWNKLKSEGRISKWVAWAIHHLNVEDTDYRYRKVGVITDNKLNNGTGGNTGKSYFCTWYPRLMAKIGIKVQVLSPGKLADMAMQLSTDAHQVLIDIPASRSDNLQWSFIEQLKVGRVDSPKYYSTTLVMRHQPVSVLILCNHHPAKERRSDYVRGAFDEKEYTLSNDRWEEYDITSEDDVFSNPIDSPYVLPDWLNFPSEYNPEGIDYKTATQNYGKKKESVEKKYHNSTWGGYWA